MESFEKDPDIKKAHDKYEEFLSDDQLKDLYLRREMYQHDLATLKFSAREKGLKEGREVGLKEGLEEGREEGREEGQVTATQHSLVLILEVKNPLNESEKKMIQAVRNLNKLEEAVKMALSDKPIKVILDFLIPD